MQFPHIFSYCRIFRIFQQSTYIACFVERDGVVGFEHFCTIFPHISVAYLVFTQSACFLNATQNRRAYSQPISWLDAAKKPSRTKLTNSTKQKWSKLTQKKVKVKVADTRLPSIGFRSWSRCLAVSLQVMWVINPTVGCHYFPPGLQLPPQPLKGLLSILLLGEQRHNGCEQFA